MLRVIGGPTDRKDWMRKTDSTVLIPQYTHCTRRSWNKRPRWIQGMKFRSNQTYICEDQVEKLPLMQSSTKNLPKRISRPLLLRPNYCPRDACKGRIGECDVSNNDNGRMLTEHDLWAIRWNPPLFLVAWKLIWLFGCQTGRGSSLHTHGIALRMPKETRRCLLGPCFLSWRIDFT